MLRCAPIIGLPHPTAISASICYLPDSTYVVTKKQYDALGKVSAVSNPYRPAGSEAEVNKTTTYGALGRVLSVTTPDNATATTAYPGSGITMDYGEQATITDQAGKKRRTKKDALGRLRAVIEDPSGLGYLTQY